MARKKRKCPEAAANEPPAKKKIENLSETRVIKRSLKSAMKQPYDESVDVNSRVPESQRMFSPLRQEIQKIVIEMTKLLKAGSLNIHVSLYDRYTNGTRAQIESEFTKDVARNDQFFLDYFRGISMIHGDVVDYELHPTIRRLCLEYEVNPPDIEGIGNMFSYSIKKYQVNFMNNICTHAYTRIRKYFYAKTRSKKRVYDTLHFLFHQQSEKTPDPELIDALIQLRPIKIDGNGAGYFAFMQDRWYQFVPLFMALQGWDLNLVWFFSRIVHLSRKHSTINAKFFMEFSIFFLHYQVYPCAHGKSRQRARWIWTN